MIGKLLADGNSRLRELGLGGILEMAAETGSVLKITRNYLDSLTIETRMIDSVLASTEITLFGQKFSTPVMTAALSGLGGICSNPMVEMAQGVKTANAVMWVGIGTGAKTIKIVKPYKDKDKELIFAKIAVQIKTGRGGKHGA